MSEQVKEVDISGQAIEDMILSGLPTTLEQAIQSVMAKIRWIQRKQVNGVSYPVLLEDKVLEALHPEFLRYSLSIAPSKVKVALSETFTDAKGRVWNRVILTVRYTLTHGPSGQQKTIEAIGEGSDIGDKASAKAMTMAIKYALRQAFFVRTGTDDPDKTPSEESAKKPVQKALDSGGNKPNNTQASGNSGVFDRALQAMKSAATEVDINRYIQAASERNFDAAQMAELKRLASVRSAELAAKQKPQSTGGIEF